MPMYDYKYLVQSATANTSAAVGTNTINTGVTYPGLNKSGQFGLHIKVTTAFTSLASGVQLWIIHSASDNLSTGSTKHSGIFIPVASLTLGAHFFIPCSPHLLFQYIGFLWSPVSEAGASGATTVYFGTKSDLSA